MPWVRRYFIAALAVPQIPHATSLGFLFSRPATRTLTTGDTVSLHGSGPPVLFSSGLYGLMPRRIYTELFKLLERDVTLVVLDDAKPVTAKTVEDVADCLSVHKIGFFAHSSFDYDILNSERICRGVLCDPVITPTINMEGIGAPLSIGTWPALVLQADLTYDGESTGIPEVISPRFTDDRYVQVKRYPDVGHADMLDDTWASLGPRAIPWMKGAKAAMVPFEDWTFSRVAKKNDTLSQTRRVYREWIAQNSLAHFRECFSLHQEAQIGETVYDVDN